MQNNQTIALCGLKFSLFDDRNHVKMQQVLFTVSQHLFNCKQSVVFILTSDCELKAFIMDVVICGRRRRI